ncbi:hypothetical protein SeMB42_g01889 [Synchytrium endobioticum]|uniref:TOG domain-containing protein n=1 Tax=Synchytrium endobioticum TaxID=286115 RepID=A0A507DIK3_9FUNG|nr:hypothetical protein SeLEV6574_g05980 [Synchytrium endobioticum]TPX51529.1 hypothetical protein SeMB42_g01889 [Synchytrium endobioticum]
MTSPVEGFLLAATGNNLDKKIDTIEILERALQSCNAVIEPHQVEPLAEHLSRALKSPQAKLSQTALAAISLVLRNLPSPSPLKAVVPILLPTMTDRLSDAKERVREMATLGLVDMYRLAWNLATNMGTGSTDSLVGYLERIVKTDGFNHKAPRAREQSITWLQQCISSISDFPTKSFVSTLVRLLEDSNEGVRAASKDAIISIYNSTSSKSLQQEFRKEFAKKSLRPPILDSLLSHLVDIAGASYDLMATESKIKKPSSIPVPHTASATLGAETPMKGGMKSAPSGGGTAAATPDPIRVLSARDLDLEISNIASIFKQKETEENWEDRDVALQKVRGLCRGGMADVDGCSVSVKGLLESLVKSSQSLRTALVMSSCICISDLATHLGTQLDHIAEPLVSALIKNTAAAKKLVATAASQSLNTVLKRTTYSYRNLSHVVTALGDKNAAVRGFAALATKALLEESVKTESSRITFERSGGLELVEKSLRKGLGDASAPVREGCRDIVLLLQQFWPDKIENLIETLDPSTKKALARSKSALPARNAGQQHTYPGVSMSIQTSANSSIPAPPIGRSPTSPSQKYSRLDYSISTPAPNRTMSAPLTKSSPTSTTTPSTSLKSKALVENDAVNRFMARLTSSDASERLTAVDEAITCITAKPPSFPSPKMTLLSVGNALISSISDSDAKVSTRACHSRALDVLVNSGIATLENLVSICIPLASGSVGPSSYLDHVARVYPADVTLSALVAMLSLTMSNNTKPTKKGSVLSLAGEQDSKLEVFKRAGAVGADNYKQDEVTSYFSDAANARVWLTKLIPILNATRQDCEGARELLTTIWSVNKMAFERCLSTFDEDIQTYIHELVPESTPSSEIGEEDKQQMITDDDDEVVFKESMEYRPSETCNGNGVYSDGLVKTPTPPQIPGHEMKSVTKLRKENGSVKKLSAGDQSAVETPPHNQLSAGVQNFMDSHTHSNGAPYNLLDERLDWSCGSGDDEDDVDDSMPFGSDSGVMDETVPDDFADISMSRNSVIMPYSSSRPSMSQESSIPATVLPRSTEPTATQSNGTINQSPFIEPRVNSEPTAALEAPMDLPPIQLEGPPSANRDRSSTACNRKTTAAGLVGSQTLASLLMNGRKPNASDRLFIGATPTPARPKSSEYKDLLPGLLNQIRTGDADRACVRRLVRMTRGGSNPDMLDQSSTPGGSCCSSIQDDLWDHWGSDIVDTVLNGIMKATYVTGKEKKESIENLLVLLDEILKNKPLSIAGREKKVLDVLITCRADGSGEISGGAETALRSFAYNVKPLACLEACLSYLDGVELDKSMSTISSSSGLFQPGSASSAFHALILILSSLKDDLSESWMSRLVDIGVNGLNSVQPEIRKCAVVALVELEKHIGESDLWRRLDGRLRPDQTKILTLYADKTRTVAPPQ